MTLRNALNTGVSGLGIGVNRLRWTINNGPCVPPSSSDEVDITVFNPASPNANAGPAQQVCAANTTLAGNAPLAPATGLWTVVSGAGTFTNAASPTTAVTGLAIGANVFQWTLNNGPCANGVTTSQVTVTRFDGTAPAAAAGADQDLCTATGSSFGSTSMNANSATAPGTGTWTVISGTATITAPASPTNAITADEGAPVDGATLNARVPPPTRLLYNLEGQARNLQYQARGEVLWRHDGREYNLRLTVSAFLIGSRSQMSEGDITPQGLAPRRYADKWRGEQAAHFNRDTGRITFSVNTPDAVLLPGAFYALRETRLPPIAALRAHGVPMAIATRVRRVRIMRRISVALIPIGAVAAVVAKLFYGDPSRQSVALTALAIAMLTLPLGIIVGGMTHWWLTRGEGKMT